MQEIVMLRCRHRLQHLKPRRELAQFRRMPEMAGQQKHGPAKARGAGASIKSRDVTVSKAMSKLLRHQLDASKIERYPGGYISVKDMLEYTTLKSQKVTFDEVKSIVADNDKQRFSMVPKSSIDGTAIPSDDAATTAAADLPSDKPQNYLIRANQGHSVEVASEDLLKPLEETDIPAVVVHGTTHGAWCLIAETGGLQRMGRVHIHFASGLPAGFKTIDQCSGGETPAAPVISGLRNTSTVLIYLDVQKAMSAGIKFWTSENGVILTEGDEHGVVGMELFKRVEDRTGGLGVLVQDGQVIKEAPASWQGKGMPRSRGAGQNRPQPAKPRPRREQHDEQIEQIEQSEE